MNPNPPDAARQAGSPDFTCWRCNIDFARDQGRMYGKGRGVCHDCLANGPVFLCGCCGEPSHQMREYVASAVGLGDTGVVWLCPGCRTCDCGVPLATFEDFAAGKCYGCRTPLESTLAASLVLPVNGVLGGPLMGVNLQ